MTLALLRIAPSDRGGYRVVLCLENGDGWEERESAEIAADALPAKPEEMREVVLAGGGANPALMKLGEQLEQLLLPKKIADAWAAAAARARDAPARLLLDVDAEELRGVPWELLIDGAKRMPRVADVQTTWARAARFDPAPADPCDRRPVLRVLVVVGSDRADERIDVARELAGIHEGFAQICGQHDIEVLERPTKQQLRQALEQHRPHILHFVGHGRPEGLGIAPPPGEQDGWTWKPFDVAADLPEPKPALVVLNACRSADPEGPAPDPDETARASVWRMAETFAAAGALAVVGMQGNVETDAAAAFSTELYRRLARGDAIDVAVAKARISMTDVKDGGWDRPDPYLPVLTLTARPERVVPPPFPLRPERRASIEQGALHTTFSRFVDRTSQRRHLWNAVIAPPGPGRCVAIVGDLSTGKTALLKWCVTACALRGRHSAYVDLDRHGSLDVLPLLNLIAEGLHETADDPAAVAAAFDRWLDAVDRLQNGKHEAPGRWGRAFHGDREDLYEAIVSAFTEALREIPVDGHLVLALDHVDLVERAYWQAYVLKYLIHPVLLDASLPVALLLGVSKNDAAERLGDEHREQWVELPLGPLPPGEYAELATEYMRAQRYPPEKFNPVIAGLGADVGLWTFAEFKHLDQLAGTRNWEQDPA